MPKGTTHFYCVYCMAKFSAPDDGRVREFCSNAHHEAQLQAEKQEEMIYSSRESEQRNLFVELGGGRMRRNHQLSDEN